jgi:flagellar biosynthesis chaperone FliJ
MKTRYSSLVGIKKDAMQKSERLLQEQNHLLQKAQKAHADALEALGEIQTPQGGKISDLLASRGLLDAQRVIVQKNQEWVSYAHSQVQQAKEALKKAMIEYEKFNYLELEEMKKILQEQKIQEAKNLDEIALLTHTRKMAKNSLL